MNKFSDLAHRLRTSLVALDMPAAKLTITLNERDWQEFAEVVRKATQYAAWVDKQPDMKETAEYVYFGITWKKG